MSDGLCILFISTWPAGSGLSTATVHPHLEVLASDRRVQSVHYVSMEPCVLQEAIRISGVSHEPVIDGAGHGLLDKALNHQRRMTVVTRIARRVCPDLVICRGAPAGAFGVSLRKRFGTPFCVESFEPHAEYMRSNGIWSKYDPRYLAQRRWERLIKGQAETLVAVSESYAAHLVRKEELSADKVRTVPCWVDFNKFKPCAGSRAAVRKKLNAEKALICVYVGKFGGMYYEREAARTLELMHEVIGDRLFVMILSPDGKEKISGLFRENSPIIERLWIGSVRHDEVPMYLSGADFAVSFHRTSPWSFAYSPIKHAEYWAMGLPTIIPAGVGDEARWIEEKRVGAVMNVGDEDSVREATRSVISLLADESHRSQIRDVAIRLRGRERLETVYGSILGGYRNQ